MTILQELAALYETRAEKEGWARPGYSQEKIGGVVVLNADGKVREIRSLMAPDQKGQLRPRSIVVPKVSRTSGIKPATLWDKTAYALGITETEDGPGQAKRTKDEHAAFRAHHIDLLQDAGHPALIALRQFCETWEPEQFSHYPDAETLVDQNLVFRFDGGPFLHDLPEAQAVLPVEDGELARCLLSGAEAPVARLHPVIKGVMGAQSSGAALVSFNNDAETSHGKEQGRNAPVSARAAFAYGTALNGLLAKGSGNNLRIGGDTVVFWADALAAEDAFMAAFGGADAERDLRDHLKAVAEGRPADDGTLDPEARLFVLGLAPNAARLSVRYWHPGTLQGFARTVTRFWSDMAIQPSPFAKGGVETPPKPWALLYDLAAQRDAKNIPAGLGGDLMRAILTGGHYPATLLPTVLGRLRVEGEPEPKDQAMDGRRAALIAAVLRRNYAKEVPMALDENATDQAYLLGRLFGAYAYAEKSYQERGAGLRQKYLGAASATPARIFPVLMRGYEHNLATLRKAGGQKAGAGVRADKAVAVIMDGLAGDLPTSLPLEEQGRFFIGFYHQFSAFFAKPEKAAEALIEIEGEDT